MAGKLGAAFIATLLVSAGLLLLAPTSTPVQAEEMCDPTTIEDLLPPPPETTTTTLGETASTNPGGAGTTTTTAPETTTTAPATTTTTAPNCEPFVYELTFPLAVEGRVISVFGDPRDGGSRLHKGIDIAAPRLTPVVATADGVVTKIDGAVGTEDCCWMILQHHDGWQSWYIHLNNDTHRTDDGLGLGVRLDLQVGDEVIEGEVLGWLGDSGNAEDTRATHLHYELRTPGGEAVDALATIRSAAAGVAPREGASGAYLDDDGTIFEWLHDHLAALGILWACDEQGIRSCPDDLVAPEDLARLATLLHEVEAPLVDVTNEPLPLLGIEDPSPFLVEKILGCTPDEIDCLPNGITAAELARLAAGIVRYHSGPYSLAALSEGQSPGIVLPNQSQARTYMILTGHIGRCELPLSNTELLTRAEALERLLSWTDYIENDRCRVVDQPTR